MSLDCRSAYVVGAALLWLGSCTMPDYTFTQHSPQDAGFEGSGGSAGTGGKGGTGGAGSGGTSASGGASGVDGGGGASGTGCQSDADCADGGKPKCNPKLGYCTVCVTDAECPQALTYCAANGACLSGCKLTDPTGCQTSEICTSNHECKLPCENDDACPLGQICDLTNKWCIDGCTATHGCDPQGLPDCCSGQCVATSLDPNNCGQCGNVCPSGPDSVPKCAQKICTIWCTTAGHQDCDKNPLNGCETDVTTDPQHCGDCTAPPCNGSQTCVNGKCT